MLNLYYEVINFMSCLNDIAPGETACVISQSTYGTLRRRLMEIGLIEGTQIACVGKSPCGDPRAYLIRGVIIALRNEDCRKIQVAQRGAIWG